MGLGDLANLLKGVQVAQSEMKRIKESLEASEIDGSSADGAVTVRVNGRGELLSLKIAPRVIDPQHAAALEGLVCEAVRQATAKSRQMMQDEMAKAMSAMGLPNMAGLAGLMGNG